MLSFCGPFPPATVRLDGARAAGTWFLCWSGVPRIEATRPSLEPLWEVPQPFLRPARSPVVIGDLVVFPRKVDAREADLMGTEAAP